ncbi:MAG: phage terminase large subunit [Planctomycetes bacterium]|nr:phage terminase large subunit [Planctomycetota bacterium]
MQSVRTNYLPLIRAEASRLRLEIAASSPHVFAESYLGHYFELNPSRMHKELFQILERMSKDRGSRIAIAAPRGHAKTTVVGQAYVLWSALFEKEKFILIVSSTKDQAAAILHTIKHEIESNPLLHRDFPGVCFPPGERKPAKPWRGTEITLPNGVTIKAVGANQGIRGSKRRQHRPDLIIVDDLEDPGQTESAEQREKLRSWFEKTLLKTGEPRTNVIVVGTILHYDALLANLTHRDKSLGKGAGWKSRIYRAVESFSERTDLWDQWEQILYGDAEFEEETGERGAELFLEEHRAEMRQGTKVLWPQWENYESLMRMRAVDGRASFQSEKQNEPLDPEKCLFRESNFRYWDSVDRPEFEDVQDMLHKLGHRARIYGACDPSLGKRHSRGDYSAIITAVIDRRYDRVYVIDADIARRTPNETIDRIVTLAKMYEYYTFVVETNQFQVLLVDQLEQELKRHRISIDIEQVDHRSNKQTRIEVLEPLVTRGVVRFSRRHGTLMEQLRQFPLGAHDDGPDALEMVIREALDPTNYSSVFQIA